MSDRPDDLASRLLDALGSLPSGIARAAGPSEVAALVAGVYRNLWDADWCRVWWADADRTEARMIGCAPAMELREPWQYQRVLDGSTDIVASVVLEGRQRIEADATAIVDADPRMAQRLGARSGCHTPLVVAGEIRGDMTLVSTTSKGFFQNADAPLLRAAAGYLASAIELAHARNPEWRVQDEPSAAP
ncbi:MAG: hypothetical protein GEU81_17800 [Nitriliruptorales bacterium]|nr:hypothetical protein [Nitriliruptorales bacterium]